MAAGSAIENPRVKLGFLIAGQEFSEVE